MPTWIARRTASSRDGSTFGGTRGQVMVTAADERTAKAEAADMLECRDSQITLAPYVDYAWEALKRGE